jgi:hypothetical protein
MEAPAAVDYLCCMQPSINATSMHHDSAIHRIYILLYYAGSVVSLVKLAAQHSRRQATLLENTVGSGVSGRMSGYRRVGVCAQGGGSASGSLAGATGNISPFGFGTTPGPTTSGAAASSGDASADGLGNVTLAADLLGMPSLPDNYNVKVNAMLLGRPLPIGCPFI